LFPLEVALDLDLWRNIWRLLNLLKGADHVQALRLMGMLLDHTNLMWASRYKIFHHLSEEEIINYTLPFGVRVKDRLIRSVASGEDAIPLVAEIYPDLAGLLNEMRDPVRDLPIFEFHLRRRFRDTCQKTFLGDPFHVGILLGYLFLLEMEIQDLTVLLEAKSLGLSSSVYQSYLLFSAADEQIQPGR
jgi:vacuolar-type H+-ATPase subunit C/Vma6